jgi:excinuclease ABC subunit C
VSLAKKEELIYTNFGSEPIRLTRNHLGLKLLQYVRDEAHRFAQHYHHILRRKALLEVDVAKGRRPPKPRARKASAIDPASGDPPPPAQQ